MAKLGDFLDKGFNSPGDKAYLENRKKGYGVVPALGKSWNDTIIKPATQSLGNLVNSGSNAAGQVGKQLFSVPDLNADPNAPVKAKQITPNLGAGLQLQPIGANQFSGNEETQQPNSQQLPMMNYQGNGQMRLGGLGEEGKDYIQSSNLAGMDRVQKGLADRGGLSIKAPTQSAEAQAAGTTDFWLNHNKADQVKADIANKQNTQNQQAQIQNLMNMALTAPNGSMSPSEWNAAARNQKAAQMMLGQLLGAEQSRMALEQHAKDTASNREVGLASARTQGVKNQRDYELAMANLGLQEQKANQDQYMPVTLKDYQDGMVTGERIVPFNKRNPNQTLGGSVGQQQTSSQNLPAAVQANYQRAIKEHGQDAADQMLQAYLAKQGK